MISCPQCADWGARAEVRAVPAEDARAAGHQVQLKKLRAAEGGLEACVVPLQDGTYRFVCDDAPSPDDPQDVSSVRGPRQFRVSFRRARSCWRVYATRWDCPS